MARTCMSTTCEHSLRLALHASRCDDLAPIGFFRLRAGRDGGKARQEVRPAGGMHRRRTNRESGVLERHLRAAIELCQPKFDRGRTGRMIGAAKDAPRDDEPPRGVDLDELPSNLRALECIANRPPAV